MVQAESPAANTPFPPKGLVTKDLSQEGTKVFQEEWGDSKGMCTKQSIISTNPIYYFLSHFLSQKAPNSPLDAFLTYTHTNSPSSLQNGMQSQ